jgi:hypothetical protein
MKASMNTTAKVVNVVVSTFAAIAVGLGLTSTPMAQSLDFNTEITIAELMEALVMPEADVIWNAVQFSATEDGEDMIGPETDEDWLNIRHNAIALAEVANNLMIPGRPANRADAPAPEGELAPADIEALIDAERGAWNAYAQTLHTVAMQAVEAVDARDLEAIFLDTGGALDAACEGCHRTFWYPDQ